MIDISEQIAKMQEGEDSRSDIERHAQNWIERNRTTVDTWLDASPDATA